MPRLGIFFTNLLPIAGAAAVLTLPLIGAVVVFSATNDAATVELRLVVAPTNLEKYTGSSASGGVNWNGSFLSLHHAGLRPLLEKERTGGLLIPSS